MVRRRVEQAMTNPNITPRMATQMHVGRDVPDIFLGTHLYWSTFLCRFIEQVTINRLVDAKPDEMRVYIEEAATVYRAIRRVAVKPMLHLDHTTQNLSRLEDIASELKSQLKTLKRKSESAIQYKELEEAIRTMIQVKLSVFSM